VIPTPDLLDINAVIGDLAPMLQRVVGAGVALRIELDPGLGGVFAERTRFDRLLLHLALNARDAMPSGGTLTIATANVAIDGIYLRSHPAVAPGSCVQLTVHDSGVVIADAAPSAAATDSEVAVLVRDLGGHLWLSSQVALGTTAKIFLPRVEALPGQSPTTAAGRGETILLVEDEGDVRELIRGMLASVGYSVVEAASGGEALERCADPGQRLDLVMSDVVMPGMSGPELAERLVASRPGLRVLLMSGYLDQGHVMRGVARSEVRFLEKPFLTDDLLRSVRSAIERR